MLTVGVLFREQKEKQGALDLEGKNEKEANILAR